MPLSNFIDDFFQENPEIYNKLTITEDKGVEIVVGNDHKNINISYADLLENPIKCLERVKLELTEETSSEN